MVKMEVIFKNGLAVSNIVKLHNLIKKCGGDGVFVNNQAMLQLLSDAKECLVASAIRDGQYFDILHRIDAVLAQQQ
jgi:hypothetical protein